MAKKEIQHRIYKAKFKDEFSILEYEIVADREIIHDMFNAIRKIERKYPKRWER